ncbi:hypothetical protein [Sutcliffiella horikoshii]|nr:hypothetical protein [Sutcliffiella horikoshii]
MIKLMIATIGMNKDGKDGKAGYIHNLIDLVTCPKRYEASL